MQVLNCKMKVVLIAILFASAVYSVSSISCREGIIYTSDNGKSSVTPLSGIPVEACADPDVQLDNCYTFSGSFEQNGVKCELAVQT